MNTKYLSNTLANSKFRQNSYEWYIPEEMKKLPNWVAFRSFPNKKEAGKLTKQLLNPNINEQACWAKSNDPSTWSDYKTAFEFAMNHYCTGIAFALQKDLGICCIDIDHCIGETSIDSEALKVLEIFQGTYTEKSISGKGFHIFCKGDLPKDYINRTNTLEMYDDVRFISMTGAKMKESESKLLHYDNLAAMNEKFFGKKSKIVKAMPDYENASVDESFIIEKLMSHPKYRALMCGDISACGNDHSKADLSLCLGISFYTKNPDEITSIFQKSRLYREKWDKTGYGKTTIGKALAFQKQSYNPKSYYQNIKRSQKNGCEI
ncbi:MAG: hypothetical protein R3Y32_00265 [Bacillota bacterium]